MGKITYFTEKGQDSLRNFPVDSTNTSEITIFSDDFVQITNFFKFLFFFFLTIRRSYDLFDKNIKKLYSLRKNKMI